MERSLFGLFTAFLCFICFLAGAQAFRKKALRAFYPPLVKCLYQSGQ